MSGSSGVGSGKLYVTMVRKIHILYGSTLTRDFYQESDNLPSENIER